MKPVLEINDLLVHIEKNKMIKFNNSSEKERMKKFLEVYNYINIFSLKYLFATGNKKILNPNGTFNYVYSYKELRYKDLEKQYKKLLKLENKMRESVLMYETELKSHLIFFLQDFLKIENLDFENLLNSLESYNPKTKSYIPIDQDFLKFLNDELITQTKNFSSKPLNYSEYYYVLIKVLSFGTIGNFLNYSYKKQMLFTLFSNYLKRKNNFFIGKQIKNLRTIITLRNSLCHKESLILFLEKGIKRNRRIKSLKTTKQPIDYLQLRINAISEIYEYYYSRKNLRKKLKEDTWIKNYRKTRLSNGKNDINFKKIKIDV